MKTYTVAYHKDEDGVIIATVKGLKGCHSYGRSLREAQANILDALSLWVRKSVTSDDIAEDLSRIVSRTVARQIEKARAIEEQALQLPVLRREIARELVASGLSTRDAALLMGVAHQRVHQIAPGQPTKAARKSRRRASVRA